METHKYDRDPETGLCRVCGDGIMATLPKVRPSKLRRILHAIVGHDWQEDMMDFSILTVVLKCHCGATAMRLRKEM